MQAATFELFSSAYDILKRHRPYSVTNLYQYGETLQRLLKRKQCLLHCAKDAIFLLAPSHETYYECFFVSSNKESLARALPDALPLFPESHLIRCSIIGKEPLAEEISKIFDDNGFSLIKKLLRMKLKRTDKKILEAMRPYAEEYRDCLSYAKDSDAEEILEILSANFDPVGDNLPDIMDIKEHIAQKSIAVLRQDDRIASLHYFNIQGNILHSLYDVTRQEYRGGQGLFMALAYFVHDDFAKRGKSYGRALGWRDAAAKKLLKHAKKSNQMADGVVIYNMLRIASEASGISSDGNL